jgi:ribosomal protein S18 acetylase RimI-like enzyme
MPEIRDRASIRSLLRADPHWSVYALGDLAPGYFEDCEWHASSGGPPALLLLYRAVSPPVLFAAGEPEAIARLAEETCEPAVYLNVQPDAARALASRYRLVSPKPMLRMALDPSRFRPPAGGDIVRLARSDTPRLEKLYADGRGTGEAPDFFFPPMVERGVFFGAEEDGELVAAAGTHLAVPEEGVAAVGNVYTRRDRRGRGLAGRLTGAVVEELGRMNIPVVALNVSRQNASAIRVYERLGFAIHCEFIEGPASGVPVAAGRSA